MIDGLSGSFLLPEESDPLEKPRFIDLFESEFLVTQPVYQPGEPMRVGSDRPRREATRFRRFKKTIGTLDQALGVTR